MTLYARTCPTRTARMALFALLLCPAASWGADTVAESPPPSSVFPIKVSENKRYFVDQNGQPVFWLGTTQWQLFREYKREEARTILEKTGSHGFAFVQVMLLGVGDGTAPNVYGQKPWTNDDPLAPNEAYFKNVDAVVRIARDNNLSISMTLGLLRRLGKRVDEEQHGVGPGLAVSLACRGWLWLSSFQGSSSLGVRFPHSEGATFGGLMPFQGLLPTALGGIARSSRGRSFGSCLRRRW